MKINSTGGLNGTYKPHDMLITSKAIVPTHAGVPAHKCSSCIPRSTTFTKQNFSLQRQTANHSTIACCLAYLVTPQQLPAKQYQSGFALMADNDTSRASLFPNLIHHQL
jgi:hypothetical protein